MAASKATARSRLHRGPRRGRALRDEMTINAGSAGPVHISGSIQDAPHQSRAASRRKNVIRLVALASAARLAKDKRTLPTVIVAAIVLVAAARLAREGPNPMDWYLARGRDKPRSSVQR